MVANVFIEPLDVLHLRGNRLFGEGDGGGGANMPPWPSVFAGALRSWMLVSAGEDPVAYGRGNGLAGPLGEVLGTPAAPGSFALTTATLARLGETGVEPLYPAPADLEFFAAGDSVSVSRLEPSRLPAGVTSSAAVSHPPILARAQRDKPLAGYWLTRRGWESYLRGGLPHVEDCVARSALWTLERRLGIAMEASRRRAAEGLLYTTDAIHLNRHPRTGFLVSIDGLDGMAIAQRGMLRLGGDGRSASVHQVESPPPANFDTERLEHSGRFRVVLTSPGLFPDGWRLPGCDRDGVWRFPGGQARLVSAAVPRAQMVSGWDMATRPPKPKPAQRVAPTGSVYWFEALEGGLEGLRKLADQGLWSITADNVNLARRAEGFNRFVIANA
ncbi:type III-B CRISPR module-associated protein Cmr3 [Aquisalimonas sp.]|uniref:type III-B CRISPR module-associated protein Cmr3 n=1 Tax=Aquisalimonas sp. TaxID=1872621 RepID=UPI0025BE454D|nr:type III-B CRISPR module-associated protein Cmr3 [Aquisalimonas sp.]